MSTLKLDNSPNIPADTIFRSLSPDESFDLRFLNKPTYVHQPTHGSNTLCKGHSDDVQ
ncbi:hypothetical protein K502DRAFT_345993 [Neoconidiobolus thromboides FSU 785]|nr:hypothetical protein K502DRAFT_345993 [Neoconidiobolus thromboides FSU 785]